MALRAGTTEDDTLVGTAESDTITGDAGNDSLVGRDGDDFIDGGSNNDTIFGGAGNDRIIDGPGLDSLFGGDGIDTFERDWGTLPGDTFVMDLNFILGLQAALGGDPNDADHFSGIENYTCFGFIGGRFAGNDVSNVIRTDMGVDTIYGNGGDDRLFAGGARDRLFGGAGDDELHGGAGRDLLLGGAGNDQFHFESPRDGPDRIRDFSSTASGNDDVICLSAEAFGGLALGVLAGDRFVSAPNRFAQDPNDRFIFDTTTHTLWYDRNGNHDGGISLIAYLSDGTALSRFDILLV